MDWLDIDCEEVETEPYNNLMVKKSNSSDRIILKDFTLREAHSLTTGLNEMQLEDKPNPKENRLNIKEATMRLMKDEEGNYQTRDKLTNNIFVVSEEMLLYRGRHYSANEIAPLWKKDCRTWLWKNVHKSDDNAEMEKEIKPVVLKSTM